MNYGNLDPLVDSKDLRMNNLNARVFEHTKFSSSSFENIRRENFLDLKDNSISYYLREIERLTLEKEELEYNIENSKTLFDEYLARLPTVHERYMKVLDNLMGLTDDKSNVGLLEITKKISKSFNKLQKFYVNSKKPGGATNQDDSEIKKYTDELNKIRQENINSSTNDDARVLEENYKLLERQYENLELLIHTTVKYHQEEQQTRINDLKKSTNSANMELQKVQNELKNPKSSLKNENHHLFDDIKSFNNNLDQLCYEKEGEVKEITNTVDKLQAQYDELRKSIEVVLKDINDIEKGLI